MMIWLSVPQIGVDRVGAARSHRSHAYPGHVSWRCKNIGGFPGNRLCSPFRSQVIDGNHGGTLLNLRRILWKLKWSLAMQLGDINEEPIPRKVGG